MLVIMRRLWIRQGSFDEFERISREQIWPNAEAAGLRIFGLFRASEPHPRPDLDEPHDMAVLFTQYVNRDHLAATRSDSDSFRGPRDLRQRLYTGIHNRRQLTLAADATHMTPVRVPIGGPFFNFEQRDPEPFADIRPLRTDSDGWGQASDEPTLVMIRRFWIEPGKFDQFEQYSRDDLWPAIEAAGARILGMFRADQPHPNDEVDQPCDMVVLATQYVSREHWAATRARGDSWLGPEDVRSRQADSGRKRHALTLATHPTFTEPARVQVGGPFFTWRP